MIDSGAQEMTESNKQSNLHNGESDLGGTLKHEEYDFSKTPKLS